MTFIWVIFLDKRFFSSV